MALDNRNLEVGTRLAARYKGRTYTAEVVQTGDGVRYRLEDGREFRSPSAAGCAVMDGVACNGWRFWSLEGQEPAGREAKAKAKAKAKGKAQAEPKGFPCPRCGLQYPTAKRAARCPCPKEGEAQETPSEEALTFGSAEEAPEEVAAEEFGAVEEAV